ncbi:tyrosine-type recombinase/integrase [Aeromonas hydrophila]|uniref:tyrosine-type recombinase/integrase n=1 Tax=Aeromonas hydrophila TaxID=644 RepID=UPI003C6FF519
MSLSGMFSFLIEAGIYHAPHPLKGARKLKAKPTAMSYLSQIEIRELLKRLDGDNRGLAILCLSTGARWSEAAELRAEHVINQRVMFVATKNGKTRVVPVSTDVSAQLVDGKSGRLFPNVDYLAVRQVLREVKPDLPHGQASHVLRHTFATHFMANGGEHHHTTAYLGTRHHPANNGLCAFCTGLFARCDYLQSIMRRNWN